MARAKKGGVLIAGGGLAGSLAALALAQKRPEVPLLMIVEGESLCGDGLWSFFETDIEEEHRWLVEPLIAHEWPGYYTAFPGGSRKIKAGYEAIRGGDIDNALRAALRPDQYRLGARIVAVRDDVVILAGGERIDVEGAIDAREAPSLSLLDAGWEHALGRDYAFAAPHRVDRPVLADATVDQSGGYRFFRCLPFAPDRMLVEEHHHSESAGFDLAAAGERIDAYVAKRGWVPAAIEHEDAVSVPIAFGGDFGAFWRVGGARVAQIGVRGGLFHPSTGQMLPDAVRAAALLTQQRGFSGSALHDLCEAHATALWKKREFYRSFNQAGYRGTEPALRYTAMERVFAQESAIIARFHAGQTTMIDRMRIGRS